MENLEQKLIELIPEEKRERFKEKLKTYSIVLHQPDEEAIVKSGNSYFGSGGYSSSFGVWVGEIEKEEIGERDNGFMRETIFKIKPKKIPTIVLASASDCVSGIDGVRYFYRHIHVWL